MHEDSTNRTKGAELLRSNTSMSGDVQTRFKEYNADQLDDQADEEDEAETDATESAAIEELRRVSPLFADPAQLAKFCYIKLFKATCCSRSVRSRPKKNQCSRTHYRGW